uniref:39S ribosomal protein L20, mitochondrial n=1 Tax=Ascaris lumbricoides TaxID=6252 RepID=A0A9J2P324_ASCLU
MIGEHLKVQPGVTVLVMRLSEVVYLRRIIDSPYHPFQVIPKPDTWPTRERLKRFMAWQYASERTTVKGAYRKQNKIFHYMNMQREDAPKLEKFYAEERLRAALAEHHFEYAPFRNMLDKAHILLDNVVLSQLAIYEPRTFKSLVMLTKQMAQEDGRAVITDQEQKYVETDASLFGTPFPRSRLFPRGPAENHKTKPRKLKPSEY